MKKSPNNISALEAVMTKCPTLVSVKPVVLFGALLGIIRDNKLIHWNNDIEFGVAATFWKVQDVEKICSEIKALGFLVDYYPLTRAISVRDTQRSCELHINCFEIIKGKSYRPLEPADFKYANFFSVIFYYTALMLTANLDSKRKGGIKSCFFVLNKYLPKRIRFYAASFFLDVSLALTSCRGTYEFPFDVSDAKPYVFNSFSINIPVVPEAVLSSIYGKDWRIPLENWSYYDPVNKGATMVVKLKKKWVYEYELY